MDFRQMSALLSSKVKQQINQEHKKNDVEIDFLLENECLEAIWNEFTHEEVAVIEYFLLHKGTDFLTYRELEQGTFPISTALFRVGLTKLRRKGIVFTLRRLWGELAYIIPKELLSAFRKQQVPCESAWIDGRPIPRNSSYHVDRGIFQVLSYVSSHPIELTKKGTIQKKDLRLLSHLFGLPKECFSAFRRMEMVMHPYENHEAIMLSLFSSWNLLLHSGNFVVIGDIESWLQISDEKRRQECLFIIEPFLDLDEKLAFLYDVMRGVTAGRPYSLSKMVRAVGQFGPDISDAEEKILTPLSNLGLIKFAVHGDDVVWEWVAEPSFQDSQLYVQPNFEILIPSFAPLALKWEIVGFADLVFQEEMWGFSLNRESIRRALDAGKNIDTLIRQLESHSAVPLPENVVQSMKQWQKDYQRIRFFDARIMEVSDARLASEFEKVEAISGQLVQRLGDRYFVVKPEAWNTLAEELGKRGYDLGVLEKQEIRQSADMEPIKIFKHSEHAVEYKVESVFPDLEDAIPGLRQIPRMWIANFQPYHTSTLRELVQKALQMGIGLKLQWRGDIYEINPSMLVNKDGYWTLQGIDLTHSPCEYRLDDIQKIQVILP